MQENRATPDQQDSKKEPESVPRALSLSAAPALGPSQMLWSRLVRDKWLVLFCVIAFSLIGLMLGTLRVPLYKAQTTIEVVGPGNHLRADEAGASPESYLQAQIRIIQSRSLLERALGKLSDADRLRLLEAPAFWWSDNSYQQKLENLRGHISAHPSEQAGMVDITLLSSNADLGAYLLNSLTQELADFDVELAWRASQHDRQWTDRQLDDLRRKWEQSEQAAADFSQSAGLDKPPAAPKAETIPGEEADLKLHQLKHTYAELKTQVALWESLYGNATPEGEKLKADLTKIAAGIRQRRAVLKAAALQSETAEKPTSFAKAEIVPISHEQATIRLNTLKQEAETNHQIYDMAATRFKETAVATAVHLGDISMVDPAVPDPRPVTPNHLIYAALGALTGLLVGVAFVALRTSFSHTFDNPALLTRYLGVQVLGTIPDDGLADLDTGYDFANQQPALHLAFDSNVHAAEAYRSIRSSLLFKVGQRTGGRRLVFTSVGDSDGKSSVIANLGAALASAQRRVLLVDGNLRNPTLHNILGGDNKHGLADLLSRQIPASAISSQEFIRATQIPDLYLLTAGLAGDRAPEILSSALLPTIIREFAKGFDMVLIDSPPVLPYSDSRSLARAADGVVLIVSASSTDRRAALMARDAISQDGAVIIGAILKDWNAAQAATA